MKTYKQIDHHMNYMMWHHLKNGVGREISNTTFHKLQYQLQHLLTNALWYPIRQRLYGILIDFNEDL